MVQRWKVLVAFYYDHSHMVVGGAQRNTAHGQGKLPEGKLKVLSPIPNPPLPSLTLRDSPRWGQNHEK